MSYPFLNQLQMRFDIKASQVTDKRLRAVCSEWLRRFCPNVKNNCGKWVMGKYWWHAYSYGLEACLSGIRAYDQYASTPMVPFYAYRQFDDQLLACEATAWPNIQVLDDDIYIFPMTMTWSFLTTHEMRIGLGPFFAYCPTD